MLEISTSANHENVHIILKVYVFADTVYMSESLYISYDLKIRARNVYINEDLTMDMSMATFNSKQKYHVVHAKQVKFNNLRLGSILLMRHRKYGRVDILDTSIKQRANQCSPKIFPSKVCFKRLYTVIIRVQL